jgi:uncharacterized membrane protein
MDVVLRRFNEQSSGELEWVLRRHCSISPLQLALAFGSVALLSGVIAAAFASFGAWGVIPFAGLEIFALAVAYVVYARHTGDFERIVLAPGRLVVEVVDGGRTARFEGNPVWARVQLSRAPRGVVEISERNASVLVGRLIPYQERVELLYELKRTLKLAPVAFGNRGLESARQGEV